MGFKRTFAPSLINSSNVKALHPQLTEPIDDGTAKSNAIARKDLELWIPLAAQIVPEPIKRVQTLQELLKLPKAHIGHFLATILPIYRQRRTVNGKRYTHASLKLKVETWQRVIRKIYRVEYNNNVITNAFINPKTVNIYSNPELQVLVTVLNMEMQVSSRDGLTLGIKKRTRSDLTPADLKSILQL